MVKKQQKSRRATLRVRPNLVAAQPLTLKPTIPADRIARLTTGTYPARQLTERDVAFVRHYHKRFGSKPFDVVTDLSSNTRVPGGGGKNAENDGARIRNYPNNRLAQFGLVSCISRTKRQLTGLGIRVARAGRHWRKEIPPMNRVSVTVPSGDEVLVEIVAEMLLAGGKKAELARESVRPLVRKYRSGTGRDIVATFRASPMVGLDLFGFRHDDRVTSRTGR
jgi:hypothetical protein